MPPAHPFFIVGCPRSGTTLLRLLLHAHSRLAVAPENYMISENLPLVNRHVDGAALAGRLLADPHFADFGLEERQIRPALERLEHPRFADLLLVIYEAYARRLDKARWGDQTPSYVVLMDPVRELFPDACFVHLLRDARDVALSWRRLGEHRHQSWWAIGRAWSWYVTTGRRTGRRLGPEAYHELHYEDLVAEPERALRGVCAFLGEDFEPAMLEYHRDAPLHIPHRMAETHHQKLVRPVLADNAGRWRAEMTLPQRLAVELPARAALAATGYPVSPLTAVAAPLRLAGAIRSRIGR